MKKFKISVLAVVAVLTISVTASVQAGVFNQPMDAYTCGTDGDGIQDLSSLRFVPCNGTTQVTLTAGSTICNDVNIPGLQTVGGVRFTCYESTSAPVDFANQLNCTGTNAVICCIKLIERDECTEDDCGTIQVYCRPTN